MLWSPSRTEITGKQHHLHGTGELRRLFQVKIIAFVFVFVLCFQTAKQHQLKFIFMMNKQLIQSL